MREPAIDGKAQDKEKKSQMAVAGLYRRVLPSPPAIEFASSEGKQLFSEALQGGTMEGFFRLVSYFQTQSEPAYCGLASLSVVLNALSIDPGRKWKGPWRWFDETMLDCCEPLEKIKAEGTTFGKVACLAHCSGAKVNTFRASESNVDEFRKHVIKCASSEDCHLIASYHRKTFKQTGTGHFSPIGGYHAARDMALILDVARFKYPPHWVPVTLLWEAINTIDETTGLTRGFLLVSKLQSTSSLLYTLSCRHENWLDTAKFLIYDVRELLKSDELHTVHDVLLAIFSSLPANANEFIKWVAEVRRREEDGCQLSNEEKGRLAAKEELLQKVRDTTLFKFVIEVLTSLPCSVIPESHNRDTLPEIAAGVCCQGAELLFKSVGSFCCSATCVKSLKCGEEIPKTVVSSTVRSNGTEQGVDMLVPISLERSDSGYNSCIRSFVKNYPGSIDVFTVLLLALPTNTWCGIKEEKLRDDICKLVSTGTLPHILQEEVLHLRGQLHFLGNCREN